MTQTTPAPSPGATFRERFRDLGSLRRSHDHRAVAGVAEGLSRHLDIDPIIVRVLFAALTFFGGAGLILYLALWLTVPVETSRHSIISGRLNRDPRAWTTIGLALGGILAAMALLGSLSWAVPHPFPFLLIVLVLVLALLALTRHRGERPLPMPSPTDPTYSPADPPPPPPAPAQPQDQASDLSPAKAPGAEPAALDAGATPETRAWWQRDSGPPTGATVPPFMAAPPPPPPRPRSHLFGLTMATIALAIAAVWIVDAATSYDVNPSVYPGTALAVIAVALLAGTWWGRSRGLIAIGILASLLTAGAAFAGPGPYGDRAAIPVSASELQSSYRMGIGRFTLHLEQLIDIEALQGRDVTVNQRAGQLRVVIPSYVAAVVDATVEHGRIDGPPGVQDLDQGGQRVVLNPDPAGRPTITLHLHVVYGNIRLERAVCPGDGPAAEDETTFVWQDGKTREGTIYVKASCS